jgi:DNA processing protein
VADAVCVQPFERFHADHPDYPAQLNRNMLVPPSFTATRAIPNVRAVAIVGSRDAIHEAAVFAHKLAFDLASAGVTVVSGGARGIDAAAHRGALEARGATWVVCPTGKDRVAPREHHDLFQQIASSEKGRLIWPFDDHVEAKPETYRTRNGLLVALSDAVVVIQARLASGSRNTCTWAADLKKPLWVVPALPWGHWEDAFNGSADVLLNNPKAKPLGSAAQLFESLGLTAPASARKPSKRGRGGGWRGASSLPLSMLPAAVPDASWTEDEITMFSAISPHPKHGENLAETAGLSMGSASTALLTLTLKDVVVEGPNGFFRRRTVA